MKSHILPLMLIIALTFSCKDDIPCDDLAWLDAEIETIKEYGLVQFFYVYQAEYKGMTVFYVDNCCPNCSTVAPEVRNCLGKAIGTLRDDIEPDKLKNGKVYWQPDDFACTIK
ncbi:MULTISPECIES: hypothetical protein [unclassified Imperialibacter]|uniref:hypothetical protein n=1 Tax=unclassified Imperialibacter TaxID=2629706 RepID=UPI0012516F8D|nr:MULTISPECIES: hypothetical protein [unclassified Imperialibacter]CAD5255220.1 conserved hypothetical protein [Imperialibacter sp. 89]CAD5256524.1 conserved hypothetical protein [Imperialibacter sp. 75]VVT20079.1 conserved hypothetical protein [Imperialibacter sp. EC-SDR9]